MSNNETMKMMIPEGNLTAMAEDETGAIVIGVTAIFWTLWTVASMFIPW